ncbi:MAG: Mss4p nuclear export [Chaenotheca gracillima]|nr:MAG: Mss4p nuclear export [Chaenotheca gracillima]
MSSSSFGAYFNIENAPKIADPPAVVHKHTNSIPEVPDSVELDRLTRGSRSNGLESGATTGPATPATPNDLEMSRPPSPRAHEAADLVQSFSNPPMNRFRMTATCLLNFANGLNDSAPGALIPYIEKDYNIGYAVVSLIFVSNALGFISAAFITDALLSRMGRSKTLMISTLIMLVGYIPIVFAPPFPVIVVAFFLLGLGIAINLALGNVFASNLANNNAMLGAMHGSYGIGGTIAPLIATSLVSHGANWSRYYFLVIGITAFNFAFSAWTFWGYEKEAPVRLISALERTASQNAPDEPTKIQLLKRALKDKTTILGALFIFSYQGAEVSISGWVISFLITYRHGNPADVGYVTAGFWGGITAGRFLLSHPAHKIGEKTFVFAVVAGSAVFQLLVWLVPNVIGDAVAVSLVGLLLGPVYPCATVLFSRLLPKNIQTSSLAFISATGSSGGAVAPFTTGILAQAVGTFVLHPVCIALYGVMAVCWFLMPKVRKRTE